MSSDNKVADLAIRLDATRRAITKLDVMLAQAKKKVAPGNTEAINIRGEASLTVSTGFSPPTPHHDELVDSTLSKYLRDNAVTLLEVARQALASEERRLAAELVKEAATEASRRTY